MDFNLKQWRFDESAEGHHHHQQQESCYSNTPRYAAGNNNHHHDHLQRQNSVATGLSLYAPYNISSSSSSDNKVPAEMGSGGCCFSMGQWQELELQAMIYRHMMAGAAVPPELLQLVAASSHQYPLQHYQTASLVQSGYWGRAAMDPEPGRCRRTDGKKWRCSRDVVAGQKYCERHMNRGKNRSRKPVEAAATHAPAVAAGGGGAHSYSVTAAQAMDFGGGGGGSARFTLSGQSPSMDLLHLNQQRPKSPFTTTPQGGDDHSSGGGGRVLRRFFDDWPGSLNHADNSGSVTDFSLKLGTGGNNNGDEGPRVHAMNGWESNGGYNQVAHMGGPLAEALR